MHIHQAGELNIDESGSCNYNGNCSGLTMIQRIRECCDSLLDGPYKQPIREYPVKFPPLVPLSRPLIPAAKYRSCYDLPSKDLALQYVSIAFDQTLPLFKFIHVPSFYARFDQFYEERNLRGNAPTLDDVRFEALLYQLFALGELFIAGNQSNGVMGIETGARALVLPSNPPQGKIEHLQL